MLGASVVAAPTAAATAAASALGRAVGQSAGSCKIRAIFVSLGAKQGRNFGSFANVK